MESIKRCKTPLKHDRKIYFPWIVEYFLTKGIILLVCFKMNCLPTKVDKIKDKIDIHSSELEPIY